MVKLEEEEKMEEEEEEEESSRGMVPPLELPAKAPGE